MHKQLNRTERNGGMSVHVGDHPSASDDLLFRNPPSGSLTPRELDAFYGERSGLCLRVFMSMKALSAFVTYFQSLT